MGWWWSKKKTEVEEQPEGPETSEGPVGLSALEEVEVKPRPKPVRRRPARSTWARSARTVSGQDVLLGGPVGVSAPEN